MSTQEGNILDTLSSPDLTAIPGDTPTPAKPKAKTTKKKHLPKTTVKPESKPVKIPKAVEAEVVKMGNNHPRNVGQPLLFPSAEALQEKIDEYFAWCDNRVTSFYSKEAGGNIPVSNPAPYTMSGLARFLGVDRQTILNYGKKEEYFGTIKAARVRVEEDVETRLMEGRGTTGAIFNLKNNFGWRDETEQTHSFKQMPKPIIDIGLQPPKEDEDE